MGKDKTQKSESAPWKTAQPYLKDIMGKASTLSQTPTEYYGGNTVAGMDQATTSALNQIEQRANDGTGMVNQAQGVLSGFMDGNAANLDGVTKSIESSVQSGVNGNALLSGRVGSPAHMGSYSKEFTNALAPYAFQANEAAQGRAMQAAQLAPEFQNLDLQALLGVGQAREAYDQRQIDADKDRFDFGQNQGWNDLNRYNALVQGHAGLGGTSTQTKPGNLLGDIVGVGSLAAGLFSDRRLKKNIKRIGQADNGLSIYSYQYVWGGPTEIGFMADEVEKKAPEAVGESHGFKMVDYSKAA